MEKEYLRKIVKKAVEDTWYNRRSMNPVEDQTESITEALHQALSMSGVEDSPCDHSDWHFINQEVARCRKCNKHF